MDQQATNDGLAFETLEKKTLSVLDALFNLAVTVYDFQPESTPVLQNRVTDFTKQLAELDRHKNDVNVRVPLSLIDYVDGGQNPDLHTKELVQTLVDKNQKSSGRIASIKMLSDELKSEVALNYPDLMKQYEGSASAVTSHDTEQSSAST